MSSSAMLVMSQPRAAHKLRGSRTSSDKDCPPPEHSHHRRTSSTQYENSPYPSPPQQHHQPYHHHPSHYSPPHQQQYQQQQQQQQQYYQPPMAQHRRQSSKHSAKVMPSVIERLPSELQSMVYTDLDYQSLIHLSTMNRYFQGAIDPNSMASNSDKSQFVMRAARDFPQHRPSEKGHDYKPGNFECYICFRVRSPDHHDMLQPQFAWVDSHGRFITDREPRPGVDRQIALRRFCIECGVREGLHAPFDCLTTRTGRDLWICRCRRIWSKPGCLRCPDCRGDCPLRPKKKFGAA